MFLMLTEQAIMLLLTKPSDLFHADQGMWFFLILIGPDNFFTWQNQLLLTLTVQLMIVILTEPSDIFHTDRGIWCLSYWPSQVMFFILTETGGVFHTEKDRWCFSYWSSQVMFCAAKWWKSFWETGDHNSGRHLYFKTSSHNLERAGVGHLFVRSVNRIRKANGHYHDLPIVCEFCACRVYTERNTGTYLCLMWNSNPRHRVFRCPNNVNALRPPQMLLMYFHLTKYFQFKFTFGLPPDWSIMLVESTVLRTRCCQRSSSHTVIYMKDKMLLAVNKDTSYMFSDDL